MGRSVFWGVFVFAVVLSCGTGHGAAVTGVRKLQQTTDYTVTDAVKEDCSGGQTILSVLGSDSRFSLLKKAFSESDMGLTLDGPGPTTLFGPTDAAFRELSEKYSNTQSSVLNLDLQDLLRYHLVIGADVNPENLGGMAQAIEVTTAQNRPVRLSFNSSGTYLNGQSRVLETLDACNGRIVAIGSVLLPNPTQAASEMPIGTPRAPCRPGYCCDVEPPGEFGCADQKAWDKCDEPWMMQGGYCRETCNRCSAASMVNASIIHDYQSAFVNEGLLYQQWTRIGGSRMRNLDRSDRFQYSEPSYTEVLKGEGAKFQGPGRRTGLQDTGNRMSGHFCAPADGEYQFYISSDDSSRLFISDSPSDRDNRVAIAGVDGWKRKSEWEKQKEPMVLNKGQTYFLEALHKNGGGSGHIKVGVRMPNGVDAFPIPADMFTTQCAPDTSDAASSTEPVYPPEEGCACTETGVTGTLGGVGQVDTGFKGCHAYESSEPIENFAQFGQELGERLGGYLNQELGWGSTSSELLGGWWRQGAAMSVLGGASQGMNVNICYVSHPNSCPLAQPSARYAGAAYRPCG